MLFCNISLDQFCSFAKSLLSHWISQVCFFASHSCSGGLWCSVSSCTSDSTSLTVAYRDSEAVCCSKRRSWILVSPWDLRPRCCRDAEKQQELRANRAGRKLTLVSWVSALRWEAAPLQLDGVCSYVCTAPAAARGNNLVVTFCVFVLLLHSQQSSPVRRVISATGRRRRSLVDRRIPAAVNKKGCFLSLALFVGWFGCLFVSKIKQKLAEGFPQNLVDGYVSGTRSGGRSRSKNLSQLASLYENKSS